MTMPGTAAPDPSTESLIAAFAFLAAGELAGFARLANDAAHAPELRTRISLSRMAAAELAPIEQIEAHLLQLGADPEVVDDRIWEFRELLAEFDARTLPRDWWERLVRTYIGYGVFSDLEREIAAALPGRSGAVAANLIVDTGLFDLVVTSLRPMIDSEAQLGARLALWGRRVVGEALGIASRMLQSHPDLAAVAGLEPVGGKPTPELLTALLGRLTGEHARRMNRLALTA